MKEFNNRFYEFAPLENDEYIFMFEELELAIPEKDLHKIKELHNSGDSLYEISREMRKNIYEVLFALIYLVKKNHKIKPFKLS